MPRRAPGLSRRAPRPVRSPRAAVPALAPTPPPASGRRALPTLRLLLTAVLSTLLLVPGSAEGQAAGPPLPPGHWGYELLKALDAAGMANAWMTDFQPSSRSVVEGELSRIVRGRFGAAELASAWARRLRGLHPVGTGESQADRPAPPVEGGAGPAPGSAGSAPLWEVGADLGYRSGDALLDPGDGAVALVRGAVSVGRRLSAWVEAGRAGRERLDDVVRSGGVSLPVGPFDVTVGRLRLRGAGPAATSVQLGGRTSYDALHLTSRSRPPLPGLEWLFGPVAWHFALAPWDRIGEWDRGWVGLGGAVAEPTPAFRIGAVRVARFGGTRAGAVTPERLLRTVFILQNQPSGWDDQKIELTGRLRWRLFGQPLSTYVVLGQEDPPPWRDPAIVAGVLAPVLRGEGLYALRYEYRAVGARARWCPFCDFEVYTPGGAFASANWYRHGIHPDYERNGVPVGMALGGYGASHVAGLTFWDAAARFRIRGWAFFQVREDGNLLFGRWPGKRRGAGLEAGFFPAPGVEATLRALGADGPRIEGEWGLEAGIRAAVGGGEGS